MNDTPDATEKPATSDTLRMVTIAIYVLYLLALPLGITAFVGVIMAYASRDDARGTPFESHIANAIDIFWVFFVGMLIVVPLCFVVIGLPLLVVLYVWTILRTVKGLVRAIDSRAYAITARAAGW
jgi:uncharacterized membrane protein